MFALSDFRRAETADGVEFTCALRNGAERERISFRIATDPESASRMQSAVSAFVVGMLAPALERGEPLHVEHEFDAALLYRVNQEVIPVLAAFDPAYTAVAVTADAVMESAAEGSVKGSVLGLSCGVDSLDVLASYRGEDIPARYRISSLAVFDVGAFGLYGSDDARQRREATLRRVRKVAEIEKLPVHVVDTDMSRFYRGAFTKSVSLRNSACGHALAGVADSYLAASSAPYRVVSMLARHARGIDEIDAILLFHLSSSSFECVSGRSGTDRFAKILGLLEHSPHLGDIDLCTRPMFKRSSAANCGTCAKCGQFLMIADRLGRLDQFAGAFDLDAYRRRKWRVTQRLVSMANADGRPTTNKEILAFLDEGGFEIPVSARMAGKLHGALHRVIPAIALNQMN